MIRDPNDRPTTEKKIRILIAGYPGIGKSTLGLSAPNPLHIDVDFGIDRVEARYRKPYIQPKNYDEVLSDLTRESVSRFDSLVFDTGGKLIQLMAPWAIKNDPKNGKRDGSLSLQGYGVVGREFVRLMDYCFYELQKNIIVLFHAIEDKDGDNTRLRLMVEGQTKNNVWIPMDLGGFIEMQGNARTLGLSNCERYYAKGTRGIKGVLPVPELTETSANDFLKKLFEQYNEKSVNEVAMASAMQDAYEDCMAEGKAFIGGVVDAESANIAAKSIGTMNHVLTSKTELGKLYKEKIDALKLVYDKESKTYSNP